MAAALAATCLATIAQSHANPVGGSVVAGRATIAQPSATSTIITELSNKAIIAWPSFSIPSGSSVSVVQPGAASILLNRVTGGGVSGLYGSLSANGQVWLINPAGIIVGSGASITAAGLLLSTADISDPDFRHGRYHFDIPGVPGARIVNYGTLVATGGKQKDGSSSGGSAVLAAETVKNRGVIEADLGMVVLGGAKTFAVDFAGDRLLSFAITGAVEQVAPGAKAVVENAGTLAAAGGTVLLTAQAAKGVLDNVINTSGIVEATSVASVDGKIVLSAAGGGTEVSGTLDASGKGAGETGGTVEVVGDSVTLASGARVDVSGDAGGGTALVGGNFRGAGPLPNSQTTTISAGSSIVADAINTGNGGQVAVWSDGVTTFDGSITAKGGALGGNGGYVETSGHTLDFASGSVNASAAHGAAGTWLLDPFSLTFNRAEADALASALDLNNVAVMTASDGATAGFGIVNANGNGDITFNFSVNWNSANTLFLSAYGNINIGAGVTLAGGEGSAVLMQQNTGNTNLLFNGSFEQLLPGGTVPSSTNIPGWTQSGNPGDTDVLTAEAGEGYTPEDGSYYLFVGPVGSDGVQSQSFVDRPGDSLVVSGFLAGNGSGISDFSMSFNGTPVVTVPNPVPLQPYVFYSAAVTATGNDTFSVSYRNDPSFDAIDNFTVCRASATCVNTGPVIPGAEGGGILTPAQQFQQNQTMQGANTVGQQVVNGIGNPPILLPLPPLPQFAGLPEPSFAIDLNAGVGAGAGGLGSVIGLDTGGDTYGQISGGGSTSDNPFFDIPPVTLAPHPFPLPQQSDQPLGGPGSNLFQELTVDVRRNGLYDGPPLNRGNDALWFRTGGGT